MAAELLQILSAAKSLNEQNASAQAINQHARLLDQHTGLLNHQAQTIGDHANVLNNHSQVLDNLQRHASRSATGNLVAVSSLGALLLALFLGGLILYGKLDRRLRTLEARSINPPLPADGRHQTQPAERQ